MTARKTKTKTTETPDTGQVSVKVRDGWAVYDGHAQHNGGAVVTVDRTTADTWVQSGWVEPADG